MGLHNSTHDSAKKAAEALRRNGWVEPTTRYGNWTMGGQTARVQKLAKTVLDSTGMAVAAGFTIEITTPEEERAREQGHAIFAIVHNDVQAAERGIEQVHEIARQMTDRANQMTQNMANATKADDFRYAMSSAASELRALLHQIDEAIIYADAGAKAMDNLAQRDQVLLAAVGEKVHRNILKDRIAALKIESNQ